MKKPYQQSEHRAVNDFSYYQAKLVPLSGAGSSDKLDVEILSLGLRISNKHTFADSVTFKKEDLEKDKSQARFMGAKLIRRIEMEDKINGKINKYILLDQELFLSLLADAYS